MQHKHLAIRLEGLDDEIKYENKQDYTLFDLIGAEVSKRICKCNNKDLYNLGSGYLLKTSNNDGFEYTDTEVKDDKVYLIIDPDDGGGERFLGTIDEIKKIILDILPEKYKNNKLELFIHEDNY